jgi:hypothetical protein
MKSNLDIGVDKVQVKFMLDTTKLVHNFDELDTIAGWKVNGTPIKVDNIWLPSGYTYQAKEVHKHNNGHLTMKLHGNCLSNESYLSVMFNPTHFGNGYTAHTNILQATEKAQQIVRSAGVDIDLKDGQLMRVDIAKDRTLQECPDYYATMMNRFLSFRRESNRAEHSNGIHMGNRSRQWGFYNRTLKVNLDNIENDLPENVGRMEYRLFNEGKKSWTKAYNITTLRDLSNDRDQYQEIYKDGMGLIFTNKLVNNDVVILPPTELHKMLEQVHSMYGRNTIQYVLSARGIMSFIEDYGEKGVIEAIAKFNGAETKKVRQKIKMHMARAITIGQALKMNSRPSIEYIQEIYNQYAKAS